MDKFQDQETFNALGIPLIDSMGEVRNTTSILSELAEAYDKSENDVLNYAIVQLIQKLIKSDGLNKK